MKRQVTSLSSIVTLALGLSALNSPAWISEGYVFCDANTNNIIDAADVPVPSALVVVTNLSGTFSNANWTTAQGWFGVELPATADLYVAYILGATLPVGTTGVVPLTANFAVTAQNTGATNWFLIRNPGCVNQTQPGQWVRSGYVYCDANTNNIIDAADVPVPGAVVVITNLSGTFSTAIQTSFQGAYALTLPPVADTYVAFLSQASLPVGTVLSIPALSTFSVSANQSSGTTSFLILNPACVNQPVPGNWGAEGRVFCDANTNNVLDFGDLPLANVLVAVTNLSGTFSNAVLTTGQGTYSVTLPSVADTYVAFVVSASLPPGSISVAPLSATFSLTATQRTSINLFLVRNPACVGTGPGPWLSQGFIRCDVNTNNLIDAGDVPVPGVLVVTTNLSGTFSNAAWTTAQGDFSIVLPGIADTYVTFVLASSLPAGTISINPPFVTFSLTPGQPSATTGFLIQSAACVLPPPQQTNACWLTGGGTIKGKGAPVFTFGGNVHPGCNSEAGDGGNWNVIAHNLGLHFKGEVFEIVNCGALTDAPRGPKAPKGPYSYIEFQGVGTVKGKSGKKTVNQAVYFYGRAEDRGEPGKADRLYLRVYTEAGQTLLLISAQPDNPTAMAPTVISTGNLQIHVSSCDKPPKP